MVSRGEWLDMMEWYSRQPCGEARADMRQAVGVMWQLRPHATSTDSPPGLLWPHEAVTVTQAVIDDAAQRIAAHKALWGV